MISPTARELLVEWREARDGIFSAALLVDILNRMMKFFSDPIYVDLRNSSAGYLIRLVETMCRPGMSLPEIRNVVESAPIDHQAFLFERFLYVDRYLEELGDAPVQVSTCLNEFLRYGLIRLWDARSGDTGGFYRP